MGDIKRQDAEHLLQNKKNKTGCFLVRKGQKEPNSYTLSIKLLSANSPTIKHYRIRPLDNDEGFYISVNVNFPTLEALINYYKGRNMSKISETIFVLVLFYELLLSYFYLPIISLINTNAFDHLIAIIIYTSV